MHPATGAVLRFFSYAHLPDGNAQAVSADFAELAASLAQYLPDDPESTVALRKLLEAKDAAVRAALIKEGIIERVGASSTSP